MAPRRVLLSPVDSCWTARVHVLQSCIARLLTRGGAPGSVLLRASVSGHRGVAQGQCSMPVMARPKNSHAHPGTPQPHSLPGCVTASGRKRLGVPPRTFTLGS